MEVRITKVTKGKDGAIYVTISYPTASNQPTLKFDNLLPPEVASEFFSRATKDEMDSMRGAPNVRSMEE